LLTEYDLIEKSLDEKINKKKEREIKKQQNFLEKKEGFYLNFIFIF